jgi:cytochrome c oxidase subunit II
MTVVSGQWSVVSKRGRRGLACCLLAVAGCFLPAAACWAQSPASQPRPQIGGPQDQILKDVRLEQKLNAQVPLDLAFKDETGKTVRLYEYAGKKPVMLMLIQYRCTMLCNEELNVLTASLKQLKFTPGKEFNLLIATIDPRETPDIALDKKKAYLQEYERPEADAGWHWLTGDEASIRRLADSVGFHYAYDARTDQFAHPDGVIILTPHGKIARYYFKLDYRPQDLRLGLVEAANNKIGSPLDAIALLCFHYNPATGTYSIAYMKVLRLAGIATLLFLALGILVMKLRERSRGDSETEGRSDGGTERRSDGAPGRTGEPGKQAPSVPPSLCLAFPLFPLLLQGSASSITGYYDLLFVAVTAVAVFFSLLIALAIVFLAVRYRQGSKVDRSRAPQYHHLIEVGWTVIPLGIAMGIFVWASVLYFYQVRIPAGAMEIQVVGKQWMWKLQQPNGRWEMNELHVPVGRPVVLRLRSEDVIHSFFIPAFRVKQDAIPGYQTSLWFTATRPGTYHLFCAEFCGTLHSGMTGTVTVMEPADYERWLAEGRSLFIRNGCSGCHSRNSSVRAPLLEGIYGKSIPVQIPRPGVPLEQIEAITVIANDRYIYDAIVLPEQEIAAGYKPIMPTFKNRLKPEEVLQLVGYIRSLANQQPPANGRADYSDQLTPEDYKARTGFEPENIKGAGSGSGSVPGGRNQ